MGVKLDDEHRRAALLYLKMRQFGGETLNEVMTRIETVNTRNHWQQRMRPRLMG